ncbi:hypothetical protein N3K63_09505 [Microbacterium sp. W1N]|uniref:hypothetical protein n=1 Tax=Microbacterium festucae TaxID=2977531 RepID=UPI0021C0196E|nr:hypothetical protein [Microbacterium festucae]MCT9820516.1 hypothetical protein [Microbacterium festucae]
MRAMGSIVRGAIVAGGVAVLVGVAGAAAADEQYGDEAVEVQVAIAEIEEPGVLAMSVAGTTATLAEDGSDELVRQFTGTLPTVTVADTRAPEDIPAGAGWYVLGTATDLTGDAGQPAIGAGHLGWAPHLIDGGESGLVAEGEPVQTVLDGDAPAPFGLVDQELLAFTNRSGDIASEGQWSVNADLTLRTPADVAPGDYSGTITLSLFE